MQLHGDKALGQAVGILHLHYHIQFADAPATVHALQFTLYSGADPAWCVFEFTQ